MAGLIKREDVEAVRQRARIDEVVGERVALRPAGVGSLKGLCPFHDERTPSFHVRPHLGLWHCFGCSQGGDVLDFLMRADGLSFTEAVEYLAGRYGVELHYEQGQGRSRPDVSTRQRLLEAHRIAAAYYRDQLMEPAAVPARAFLKERGFGRTAAARFGVGFAPPGWDNVARVLRDAGFTERELLTSGLVTQGSRGVYDRFRGRLMWPIRDLTGEVIGFGARRLLEDDQGPKYLNTPETPIYHKSQVLYGVDLAKKSITSERQVVVVEGYTDVMAMHLAGVTTAIATCGTAFGEDHIRVVRRLLGDTADAASGVLIAGRAARGGEVVFTFDGDEAGKKAALRAFAEDQKFYSQTFVAIASDGMDPCELRQQRGDGAVRDLVAGRVPLFRFAIRAALEGVDLENPEGRVAGLRMAAPVVARIRDQALRGEYARQLAGWLGMDENQVRRAVAEAGRGSRREAGRSQRPSGTAGAPAGRPGSDGSGEQARVAPPRPTRESDPVARAERLALQAAIQFPALCPQVFDALEPEAFLVPQYRAVFEAIRAAGGTAGGGETGWIEAVRDVAGGPVAHLVTELAVAPLPVRAQAAPDRADPTEAFVAGVVGAVADMALTRRIGEARAAWQRQDPQADPDAYQRAYEALVALENEKRRLRDSLAPAT